MAPQDGSLNSSPLDQIRNAAYCPWTHINLTLLCLVVTVYDPDEPTVLIEGILFRAAYLGSTQLVSEAQPSKAIRMMQAQEAVGRIKVVQRVEC